MKPHLKPKCLISLVNRNSSTMYSGMFPGLIAGKYNLEEVLIDVRRLAHKAGVIFIKDEILGLDCRRRQLFLKGRSPISYTKLSIDIGSNTKEHEFTKCSYEKSSSISIKPFNESYEWIKSHDDLFLEHPLFVIGSGLSAIEIVLSLRKRWPYQKLGLQAHIEKINNKFKKILYQNNIKLCSSAEFVRGPSIRCTGNQAQKWPQLACLPVDLSGRIITTNTLQIYGFPDLFASGDCGIIKSCSRPASGVWAVRAYKPLARNLERVIKKLEPLPWQPQKNALQLIGLGNSYGDLIAIAELGKFRIGPYFWLWKIKELIDRKFMEKFSKIFHINTLMSDQMPIENCRGCASKLAAKPLKAALEAVQLGDLARSPEDASFVCSSNEHGTVFQSVDGFPALIDDPWLNGRLTTLHACSDLWASGASVISAQVIITLPNVSSDLQKDLLVQVLDGVKSALEPQGAKLIGGHTYISRMPISSPLSLGIDLSLSINGCLNHRKKPWLKSGLESGDKLLISRGLGTGILFAAFMQGKISSILFDEALEQIVRSQHDLVHSINNIENHIKNYDCVHSCTDITGFGLLGHVNEMLDASNFLRKEKNKSMLKVRLFAESIPFLKGTFNLLSQGIESTMAPANRHYCNLLSKDIDFDLGGIMPGSQIYSNLMKLIIDPQTCGPLILSCSPGFASLLIQNGPWICIGEIN